MTIPSITCQPSVVVFFFFFFAIALDEARSMMPSQAEWKSIRKMLRENISSSLLYFFFDDIFYVQSDANYFSFTFSAEASLLNNRKLLDFQPQGVGRSSASDATNFFFLKLIRWNVSRTLYSISCKTRCKHKLNSLPIFLNLKTVLS